MSDEKNEGQAKPQSTESIKGWFPDTVWAFCCYAVSIAVVVVAIVLSYARIIGDGTFGVMLCVAFVVFVAPMGFGAIAKSLDERHVDKRERQLTDKLTPSTTATRKLANMSYAEMQADAKKRQSSSSDKH